jgi:hypothetical protein
VVQLGHGLGLGLAQPELPVKRPDEPAPPTPEELLQIMDQAEQNVAIFTGIKTKYTEAGWSQRGAE